MALNKDYPLYLVDTTSGSFVTDAGQASIERWREAYQDLWINELGQPLHTLRFVWRRIEFRGKSSKSPWRRLTT